MARLMHMPEVAANAVEAVLHEWSLAEGAEFGADDVVATVETDKAVVDVEEGRPGVLLKVLVGAGTTVAVGAPIAVLADPGEEVADVPALLAQLGVSDGAAAAPALVPAGGELAVVSESPRTATPDGNGVPVGPPVANGGRIFASPLARRLARERSVLLEEIAGTGPGGRILRRDVDAATARRDTAAPAPAAPAPAPAAPAPAAAAPTPAPARASAPAAGHTDVPHTGMRRAIARRLTESKQTIPHFTVRGSARVDALLALRAELTAGGTKVSVNDLVVKAAARAHVLVPRMNVIWTPDATRTFSSVDISVAVATDTGLLTPVIRGVDRMALSAVAAAGADLVGRARAGRLRQDELEGGTLSVTNLGMYGTEEFSAIINPPQSAILAVGAARQEPVVGPDGALAVASVLRVTLSADHRVIDGALAAEWMAALVRILEHPLQILV